MLDLKGKVAFVTGAGAIGAGWGNGKATAVLLARQGAKIFGTDINSAAVEETRAIIAHEGGVCFTTSCDMTDSAAVKQSVDACLERFGRIDILINNVGGSAPGDPVSMSEEVWDRQLDHNLKTAFLGCKHVLPVMEKQGSGAIVNNSSIGGTRGFANLPDYCAAKWGLIGMTKATALENAAHGIRVNVIAPGLVATERFELIRAQHAATLEARLAEVPMGRPASMEEIASTVCWLLGPGASYLTGAVLPLDGGECAG